MLLLRARLKNEGDWRLIAWLGRAKVKCECVGTLGDLDDDEVVGALMRVIFGEFHSQAASLHADRGIALGIEAGGAAQDFGGDLVFLEADAGVIEGVLSEVAEEFAQGFRAVKAMAFNKFIYLLEALLPADSESVRDRHITEM